MIKFFETENKLTGNKLKELENKLGFNFPLEFKRHLLRFNGGRCEPNVFKFIENGKVEKSSIDWFLAIYEGEYDNFEEYFKIYKIEEKRIPNQLFPIAHDPGGNLICIDQESGKVYFWDHECEVNYNSINDDDDISNLYVIAGGFDKFISELIME